MPDPADPAVLAADLREVLRPLWRRFNSMRTLSPGKVGILSHLDRFGALAATELAARERISHQAVATAVRELEEPGLVSRDADPADRRRVLIALTDTGRDRLATERAAGTNWLADALTHELDATERTTLAAAVPLLLRLDDPDVVAPAKPADATGPANPTDPSAPDEGPGR